MKINIIHVSRKIQQVLPAKIIRLLVLSLAVIYLFLGDSVAQQNLRKIYSPEQFTKNKRISGLSFSSDGNQILYNSDELGSPAAFNYDIRTKKQSLLYRDNTRPVWSLASIPQKANDLVFISVKDGKGNPHIYHKKGNRTIDLTPGEKVTASYRGTRSDQTGLYYVSNSRNPRKFDLYFYSFKDESAKLLFKNDTKHRIVRVSNNHRYITLSERKTEEISNLYVYDLKLSPLIQISPANNEDNYNGLFFSRDNKEIYYLTNHNSEFKYLEKFDLATKQRKVVYKNEWDLMSVTNSADGRFRAININKNGAPRTKIQNTKTGKFLDIPILKNLQVIHSKFSPDGSKLAFSVSDYNAPRDIYLLDIKSKTAKRIVKSLNPSIDENQLSAPEDISITSFDGLKIPAFLYRPHNSKKKKLPALIWTHGGPGGQFLKTYDEFIQYIVNQGYVVLAVNNRGSSGYGKTFKAKDNQRHGIDDLKDCIAGKKYLEKLNFVDSKKIGIIGSSYGGYLTLAALTFHPDEFKIGIDMFGISNWLNVLNNIPVFWETRKKALYAEMGNPKTDTEMLRNKSPLFFSHNIKKPLMVIQGANDPKVLRSESDNIVEKVRKNGTPVDYLIFDDEGHGIRKPKNKVIAFYRISAFLEKHLK